MIKVDDYQVLELIGVTAGGRLHLAQHVHTGAAALLKIPADERATDGLRQEYSLLQSLEVPEILKPLALIEEGPHLALVLEPFASEGLDTALTHRLNLSLPETLTIALMVARALATLHAAGIVHRDIRPANFLFAYAPDNMQLKLADLSRATGRENATFARMAAGHDWAYVSPEQTGRMNRQTDHRSDFYSLGVMLYRLLTGQLPFQADDPLEWVHCHLARRPVPPHQLNTALPPAVSGLVLKLLAKVPEERYASTHGLLADLEHCLAQWQAAGEIVPFALGQRDVADRFQIPLKLYGRERETAALLAAFETMATTGTPRLVTVAGYSGVGKSALIHALQQPVAARRSYFLAGKFDQYQRDIPYTTLAQAFDGLVQQLLGESEAAIGKLRQRLHEALGPNAQLMVCLIPRLELVIGPQPPVPELPPQQAQGRFQLVLRRFLGVFATQEHPLVLFLDDLQWVDAGTLALLADLATNSDIRYLLLLGAYRDNEVDSNHPLMHCLASIRQAGGATQNIELASLALDDVAQIAAESLHCPPAQARPLAQLVWDKTGGNPFFTRQFLAALAEEKLLQFDASQGAWRWDLPRIHAKGYTDNVVDLMVSKLARLPQETQDALAWFACLGNTADIATLGIVLEQSVEGVDALLWEAVRMGLLFWREETYTFLHDRVQEAAYSLIPEASRAGRHLRIGRLLASGLPAEGVAERIFDVVNQLNRGSELVESQQERESIAELNMLAGQRAKTATAYTSALAYVVAGAALLTADCWERRHALIFQLELNRAECEFLTGALAEAEQRLAMLSTRAATTVAQATVTCLRVDLCTTLDRSDRAIEVGLDYLRQQGIDWSPHPTQEEMREEYERIWSQLGGREIEELIDLPLMTDPASLATLDVLAKLGPPATFTDANLMCLVTCKAINLSIEHGNGDGSCFVYARFALATSQAFSNYQAAYRFGRLGCALVDQRGLVRFQAPTYTLMGCAAIPWSRHIKTGRDVLRRAFEVANRNGDLTFAAYSGTLMITNLLAAGDPLGEVQREAEHGLAFVQKARFGLVIDLFTAQLGLIRTLRGLTYTFGTFNDGQCDERQIELRFAGNQSLAFAESQYWICKLQARFLAGNYAAAVDAASRAQPLLWASSCFFEVAEYHFYSALAHAAFCDVISVEQRAPHLEALAAHYRQHGVWAASCPENFENRAALVGAELARLEGRDLDAQRLYETAIRSAHENGFVHNEGIAHELAVRFYLARAISTAGNVHLEKARTCYARWGAAGKVKQLEEHYPQLRAQTGRTAAMPADDEIRFDLLSVAKASQAISSQILLDKLIDTLMRIELESAGAQIGCLLLVQGNELTLVAEAKVEQQAVQVRRHAGQTLSHGKLPLAMLQYVRRSREPVLLMDASAPHPFASDPYFAHQHPQSVLCLPILRQSALIGLLYLENSLVTHAFPPDRVQVLELLASQAAISLDNARLYADVRDSHARIRRLMEGNIIGLLFWNSSGGIFTANDAFLDLVGYSRQDLEAGTIDWTEITPLEHRAVDERALAEIKATGSCKPFEKEFLRKDRRRVPVLIGAMLFEDSRDEGVAYVLDLSERKRTETERQARQAAEAANRAKSIFLANMSHELRTPLNGILGYARILERDPALDEPHAAKAKIIRKSGEHLLTLINDILDLAKIEAGKMELYPNEFLLPTFVQDIIDIAGVKAAQKGVELVCDCGPGLPPGIRADEKRLRQVLLNLLSNAVKFTDQGQVALRVRFAPPDHWRFEVADTGIGIAADQLKSIFEPFAQAGERQHRASGTGLGLAISCQFARLMGGEIRVESHPDQGSTFCFEIEAQPVDMASAAPMMASTASARGMTGYAGPRKKVLVVDDITDNRAMVIDLLSSLGFAIIEAANGGEALEMAQERRPDLIVMDIAMPQLDGLAVTRLLRQSDFCREVPVIAVSASVSTGDSEQCLAAGMNSFLPKPLDTDELLEQIARLLRLEWTYGPAKAQSPPEEVAIVAPPPEEMEVLHRLARRGNMSEIIAQAERLARLDERYFPFTNQLVSLARNYQSKALLRLVETHLPGRLTSHQ